MRNYLDEGSGNGENDVIINDLEKTNKGVIKFGNFLRKKRDLCIENEP